MICVIEVIEIMVKSPYTAVYHHNLQGTLTNSFQPLVAELYRPLTYSVNNHYMHLKNNLWHNLIIETLSFIEIK